MKEEGLEAQINRLAELIGRLENKVIHSAVNKVLCAVIDLYTLAHALSQAMAVCDEI